MSQGEGEKSFNKNYKRRVESSTMILLMSKDRGKPFNKKRLLQGERGGWNYQYPRIGKREGKALQDYNKQ